MNTEKLKEMFKRIKVYPLIVCLAIPYGIQVLSYFVTKNSMEVYSTLDKPPLAPSGIVFPIVWTILYGLMGISCYLIYNSSSPRRNEALTIYAIQLVFNFVWSIFFFVLQTYLISFIWLCGLWMLIFIMILSFRIVKPVAAYLQIPYLLWVLFAGYLNGAIYILN